MNEPEKRWPILAEAIFWAVLMTALILLLRACSQ